MKFIPRILLLLVLGAFVVSCAPVSEPVYTGAMVLTDQRMRLSTSLFDIEVGAPDTQPLQATVIIGCRELTETPCPPQINDVKFADISQTITRFVSWQEGLTTRYIKFGMSENSVVKVEWTEGFSNSQAADFGGIVGMFAVVGREQLAQGETLKLGSQAYTLEITTLEPTANYGWQISVTCTTEKEACPESAATGTYEVPNGGLRSGWPMLGWNETIYVNGEATWPTLRIDVAFYAMEGGVEVTWSDGLVQIP